MARTLARRIAADPEARANAVKTGRTVATEARTILNDKEPARAAGRSFRRALDKLQSGGNTDDGSEGSDRT